MGITLEDVKRAADGTIQKVKLGSVTGADVQGLLRDGGETIEFGDKFDLEGVEEDIASQDSFTALVDGTPVARLGTSTNRFITGVKDVFTVKDPISKDLEHKLDNAASGTVSLIPDFQPSTPDQDSNTSQPPSNFEGSLPGPDPDNSTMNQELENGMGTAKRVKSVIENNTSLIIVAFFILGAIGVSLGPLDFE